MQHVLLFCFSASRQLSRSSSASSNAPFIHPDPSSRNSESGLSWYLPGHQDQWQDQVQLHLSSLRRIKAGTFCGRVRSGFGFPKRITGNTFGNRFACKTGWTIGKGLFNTDAVFHIHFLPYPQAHTEFTSGKSNSLHTHPRLHRLCGISGIPTTISSPTTFTLIPAFRNTVNWL